MIVVVIGPRSPMAVPPRAPILKAISTSGTAPAGMPARSVSSGVT